MIKFLQIALRLVGFVVILLAGSVFIRTMVQYLNIDNPIIQPWNIGNLSPSFFQLFYGIALSLLCLLCLLCLFAAYKLKPFDIDTDPSVFGDKK